MNFEELVVRIKEVHDHLAHQAVKAVNLGLTLRNWVIGCHLHEYELRGEDRSKYGDGLFGSLAEKLTKHGLSNCSRRQLYRYRNFYRAYPQIAGTVSPQLKALLPALAAEEKVGTASPQFRLPAETLVSSFSYSHFELLVGLKEPLKRTFYEIECQRGSWSVRELRRQIASLYYERSGLSNDKKKLSELAHAHAESTTPALAIRDPYVFEFLGLRPQEVMGESEIEDALLDKLQEFLLELGRGFCFEARQKRILIGGEHFFVDLVFYHRVLKCHVLAELKIGEFTHEHVGQLNTYVSWYREHEMIEGDNPPVGILLCAEKNQALVKYALAGIDNQLFVSKYQLELPDEDKMRTFLEQQLRETQSSRPSGDKESEDDYGHH